MTPQAKRAHGACFKVAEDFEDMKRFVADEAAAKVEEWLSQQDPDFARGSMSGGRFDRSTLSTIIAEAISDSIDIEDPDEAASCAFDENGE